MSEANKVSVLYEFFERKKNSIRMKTEERLDQQYPLPDVYVPKSVLRALGVDPEIAFSERAAEPVRQTLKPQIVLTYSMKGAK